MYVAMFNRQVMSWVCYNKAMGSIHSAWVHRSDAIDMASDLNKHINNLAKSKNKYYNIQERK